MGWDAREGTANLLLACEPLCGWWQVAATGYGGGYDTVPIPPTTLAGNTTYWIGFNDSGSDTPLSFDADQSGSYVGSTAVPAGTWPSSFPSLARTGTPAYLLYAIEGGGGSPTPTPTATSTPSLTNSLTATPTSTATATSTATSTATVTATVTVTAPPTVTSHLHYTYDNANRRIGLTLPDGQTQDWGYDPAGRVNSLAQPGSSPTSYTVNHNGAGDLTTVLAPNGGQETWSYDGAGRVTGTSWISGTTSLFTQTVTLDAAGQRTASNDSWGATLYGYDAAGRLTSASYPDGSGETDRYDASGNRIGITSTSPISGTSVLTNTYDLADELTGTPCTQEYAPLKPCNIQCYFTLELSNWRSPG